MLRHCTGPLWPLAGLAAGLSAPVVAQDTPPSSIVVTGTRIAPDESSAATKSSAPVIETPQAVSVVPAEFIDRLNLRTVAEALNYSSGVRSQAFGSDTRIEYYQLRGFASQNLFKDGLVLTNSGPFLSWTTPAEGVERLEVLKGPSSVLYGSGSAGGLVNIVSKPPLVGFAAHAEIGADEFGSVYGSADLGGPLTSTVSGRATGLVRRGATQVELAEDNRSFGALALGWAPSDAARLTLSAARTSDRSNRPTGFLPYAGFVTPLPNGRRIPIDLYVSDPAVDRFDRDQTELGYSLEAALGDRLRFVSNGRWARIDLVYAGLFGSFSGNPVVRGADVLLNRGNSFLDADLTQVNVDSHLEGDIITGRLRHTVTAGLDFAASDTASDQSVGGAPALNVFAPTYGVALPPLGAARGTAQRLDQTGVYLQDRVRLGAIVGVFSARHDWVGVTTLGGPAPLRTEPERTTYRAGLVWVMPSGLAPYATTATSFTPLIGTQDATGLPYRPETGRSYEVGVRFQPEGIRLLASAALFTTTRDGVLAPDPRPGFPRNQSQSGRQRSRGGELEVQARPAPTLSLTAALTAFDLSIRDGLAATIGTTPTATPEFVGSAYADYTVPDGALAGLGAGAGVRHTGRSFADAGNTLVVPAATVFDAALHYDLGRVRVAANVSNLFDKAYVAACPSAGTCYAANLRRATLSVTYRLPTGDRP